jgi:dihydrofolate synthase/folylpolyglutamate synthase
MEHLTEWLITHYGQEQMSPGLERISKALNDIIPSFRGTKIVIVAGTNGKGETILRLSELLSKESHFVWTSPHILRLSERFRSEKGEISSEELSRLIFSCHEKALSSGWRLSYYEFLFYVFCTWASQSSPKYLLLEVGLGGRLDAVNAFDADIVLLPSISRDHQEYLGHRFEQILKEKLGTLRGKTYLIHFLETKYLEEKANEIASKVGAHVRALGAEVAVPGYEFSHRNQLLASAAYCQLVGTPFHYHDWKKWLPSLENRGEVKKGLNEWIFFGSHNVDGLRKLIQFLRCGTYTFKGPPFDLVIVAFSRRDGQDIRIMLRMLARSKIGRVVVTTFDHPKAMNKAEIKALAHEEGTDFVQNIEDYFQGKNYGQRLLVTGSYYFLGHVKSLPCCR